MRRRARAKHVLMGHYVFVVGAVIAAAAIAWWAYSRYIRKPSGGRRY